MKPLVIDTNVLIELFEHDYKLPDMFRRYDCIHLPATVIGEYKAGITDTRQGRMSSRKLADYLKHETVDAVPITDATAEMYAKVFKALKAQGRPIPQNDMWIAASALEHGADILTYDEHFRAVPMLTVIIPKHE